MLLYPLDFPIWKLFTNRKEWSLFSNNIWWHNLAETCRADIVSPSSNTPLSIRLLPWLLLLTRPNRKSSCYPRCFRISSRRIDMWNKEFKIQDLFCIRNWRANAHAEIPWLWILLIKLYFVQRRASRTRYINKIHFFVCLFLVQIR